MAAHHIDFWFTMGSTYSHLSVSWLADVELHRSDVSMAAIPPTHHSAKDEARFILQKMKHVPFADKPTTSAYMWRGRPGDWPSEIDGLARTLPQQAAERALLAASRRRSRSISQAA